MGVKKVVVVEGVRGGIITLAGSSQWSFFSSRHFALCCFKVGLENGAPNNY